MRSLTFSVMGIVMVAAAVGCGEPFTLSGSGGSSGSSSGMGGSSKSTSTSSGGTCTMGDLTTCAAGEYCAASDPPSCLKCSDIAQRFTFGTPQKIDVKPPDMTVNPSYPRLGALNGKPNELYFSYALGMPQHQDIGHADPTMNFQQWMKGVPEDPLINTMASEAGGLYLSTGKAIEKLIGVDPLKPILLFHRIDTVSVPQTTKLFAFDGTNVGELVLPALPMMGNTRNQNIAVAEHANPPPDEGQLWYVSNLNYIVDELVTHVPGSPTSASILVKLDNGCDATSASTYFTPWVDPTGHWLFIASPYLDSQNACKVVPGAAAHLFYIDLKTGNPLTPDAKAIFPGNKDDRTTPSMSDDLCVLYYTERTAGTGITDVYYAIRQ